MPKYRKLKAHEKHKQQVQAAFDFAVTMCYSVPHLAAHVALVEKGTAVLQKPIYFAAQNTPDYLNDGIKNFEPRLSAYIYLSLFSFFEAFINDAVEEIIAFHGGRAAMISMAEKRDAALSSIATDPDVVKSIQKLRKEKSGKEQKYRKYSAILSAKGFRFPTERLSAYGVRMLIDRLGNLKAFAILDFLAHGLALPITAAEKQTYERIRNIRNKIAHGVSVSLTLDDVRKVNDFFRDMTFRVNSHIIDNFLVIEKYAY